MPSRRAENLLDQLDEIRRQVEQFDTGTRSPPRRPFLHDEESAEVIRRVGEHDDAVTIFVGAGASIEANLPSWTRLVRRLLVNTAPPGHVDATEWAETLLDSGLTAAAATAQARVGAAFGRQVYRALYQAGSSARYTPGALARQVAQWANWFPGDVRLVTVNYDDLLEKALVDEGLQPAPISDKGGRAGRGEVPVFHLHGRVDDAVPNDPVVLSEDDYARFPIGDCWQDDLMSERLEKSMCVFVGLSFTDPNLLRWLHTAQGGQYQHVALFSRQSSPFISERIREHLEQATKERWHQAHVDAFFTDFFGEQAQILHEAALRRGGSALPEFAVRVADALGGARRFFGFEGGFAEQQLLASEWLNQMTETVREYIRGARLRFRGEQIGLGLWVADHENGSLGLWGMSDRAYTDPKSLIPLPMELVSRWTSVETVTNGSARLHDPDVYASRWRYVRGLPLVTSEGGAGRALMGALTLTSTKPPSQSVLARAPNVVLSAIDEFLKDEGTRPFVSTP